MLVYLVRHPAPAIAPGLCYGRLDIGLSPAGEAALSTLAAALPRLPVWTSPAQRCRRLANLLSPAPAIDPRLQELDFGAWEGLPWDDIPRDALDAWAADPLGFAPPGGESGATLIHRIESFSRNLHANGKNCIVVTHGGPLKLFAKILRDEPPDLLAPAPPIGSVQALHVNTVNTAHSVNTAHPPSTSPVNPPI